MDLDYDAFAFASRCAEITRAGLGDARALAAAQAQRLQTLLAAARRGSPLLRELWDGRSTFAELPPLDKRTLMAGFDRWVTDPRLARGALEAFVADPHAIGAPFRDEFVVWHSSGSSGTPTLFVQDRAAMAVYDALEAMRSPTPTLRRWLDPWLLGERAALVVANEGHFASIVSLERLRRLNPFCRRALASFSVLTPLPELVAALNDYAPTTLATYPTAAALLASEQRAGRLSIAPREVRTGGEVLSAAMRRHVAESFGCPVIDSYGASEFLCIGFECTHGRLHANSDWVILEPVDEHLRPLPPGVRSYTTLLTNLANHVQPLVRVDLGDGLLVHAGRCPCGSALPVIEVQGRHDDTLHVPGRDGRPVALLPLAVSTVLEDEAGLVQFQLRQRSPHAIELCVPGAGADERAAGRRAARLLHDWIASQGAAAGVEVTLHTGVALPQGASGKRHRIVALG